uniref:Uncharacterized protein n=1 Tax=viral metagenome TaxID=1070528 RepID=A0A6C0EKM2_9ZZZZ
MSIININYLCIIFNNNNYFNILLKKIDCRDRIMDFERIIGLLLTYYHTKTITGDIQKDQVWGRNLDNYLDTNNKDKNMYKVWSGR